MIRLRGTSSVLFNPETKTTMKKVKPFRVARMAELSREQMALVQGGANEFLIGECTTTTEGKKCYVSVSGGFEKGTCGFYYVTYSSAEVNVRYAYPTCIKD